MEQADRFNTRIETLSTLNSIITEGTNKDQARKIILDEIVPMFFTEQNKKETEIMNTKQKKIDDRKFGNIKNRTIRFQQDNVLGNQP